MGLRYFRCGVFHGGLIILGSFTSSDIIKVDRSTFQRAEEIDHVRMGGILLFSLFGIRAYELIERLIRLRPMTYRRFEGIADLDALERLRHRHEGGLRAGVGRLDRLERELCRRDRGNERAIAVHRIGDGVVPGIFADGGIVDGIFARVRGLRDLGLELDDDRGLEGLETREGLHAARERGIQLVQIARVGLLLRRIHLIEGFLREYEILLGFFQEVHMITGRIITNDNTKGSCSYFQILKHIDRVLIGVRSCSERIHILELSELIFRLLPMIPRHSEGIADLDAQELVRHLHEGDRLAVVGRRDRREREGHRRGGVRRSIIGVRGDGDAVDQRLRARERHIAEHEREREDPRKGTFPKFRSHMIRLLYQVDITDAIL